MQTQCRSVSIWLIIGFIWSVCDCQSMCLRHIPGKKKPLKDLLQESWSSRRLALGNLQNVPQAGLLLSFWFLKKQKTKHLTQALMDRMISTPSLLLCRMCLNDWSVLSLFLWTPSSPAEPSSDVRQRPRGASEDHQALREDLLVNYSCTCFAKSRDAAWISCCGRSC